MKTVPCPRCGAQAPYAPENRWRPFCSERCRSIDLGAWATESYRIPIAAASDKEQEEAGSEDAQSDKPGTGP